MVYLINDGLIWGYKARNFRKSQHDHCIEPVQVAKTNINFIKQYPLAWTQELELRPRGGKF